MVITRFAALEAVGSSAADQEAILRRQVNQFQPIIQTLKID